jgi:hypothetical protein
MLLKAAIVFVCIVGWPLALGLAELWYINRSDEEDEDTEL